ncbi:MAG: hypothetical protein RI932_1836 [Pseudomonadota bacterium]|jgi:hypothetical protein
MSDSDALERRPDPQQPKRHWSRAELASWLVDQIVEVSDRSELPLLIGIDHALSFPLAYFEKYRLPRNWSFFLEDYCTHWGALSGAVSVREILQAQREEKLLNNSRCGESRWRRVAEQKSSGAKSVFHFGVPGAVASSTHAGLVWIHFLRTHPRVGKLIHFWPFDGWIPEPGKTVVAEIYPALWNKRFSRGSLTQDQHDARVVALGMREAIASGELEAWFQPEHWNNIRLSEVEQQKALVEGWILGLS